TMLEEDLAENREQITHLVEATAPELLDLPGVGAVTAAVILTVWSHPGRIRNEAAFAMIGGICPIPASSGNTTRHRLNRGGDRRLNRALNTIVLTRMRTDPATRAYIERRQSEGKTRREIRRCLKRYISRQIFRALTVAHPAPDAVATAQHNIEASRGCERLASAAPCVPFRVSARRIGVCARSSVRSCVTVPCAWSTAARHSKVAHDRSRSVLSRPNSALAW